MGKIANS